MFNLSSEEILEGKIIKGLLKLALPLMALTIINTLYGVVDTYFVGKIGELQVGAVSLVAPLTNCGVAFATGLAAAGVSLISRSLGAGNKERANELATHIIVMALFLGGLLSFICIAYAKPILAFLETPEDIYLDTRNYYLAISFDYIFLFVLTLFQSIRQASGDSKSGVIINACASIFNCFFDPLFISFLGWGTFGAAFATVLSKALMAPIALYLLFKGKDTVIIDFNKYKMQFELMINIIKVAIPASIGQLLQSFGFVLMSKEIVSYGSIAMSGYGIGSHMSSLFYIPVYSIGTALTTFVGQALGAQNIDRAKECYKQSQKLLVFISIFTMSLGFLVGKTCVHLFVKNPSLELESLSLEYFYYSIGTTFFMGWLGNLNGVFNGSTNTKISMILSSCRILFVRMPVVYILKEFTNLGISGIWISMIISNIIICTMGQILYKTYPWYSKSVKI